MKRRFQLYKTPQLPEVFRFPSRRMIKTLKGCLQFEGFYPGKPYGPADISGSFSGLYKRGLLDIKRVPENKFTPVTWYVTIKGLHFLLSSMEKATLPNENMLLCNIYKLQQNILLLHNTMYNLQLTTTNNFKKLS